MVQNTVSIVGLLQVSLLCLIWLTYTTVGEQVHSHTSEKLPSHDVGPGDHTALNKFIEDVLKAQDELADIRTMNVSGLHKPQPQKVEYLNGVNINDHTQQMHSGSVNIHKGIKAFANSKETSFSNPLETHKIEHSQNIDKLTKKEKQQENAHINDPSFIKARNSGKLNQLITSNYEKQSYQPNFRSNEDDEDMLKYLTSNNYPKENSLFQQGQMQEKQTLDTDRLSQIFTAMKKNYFPNAAAVKPENMPEDSGESKFDQSNADGDDKIMLYEDLLHLNDKQINAENEPMQTSSVENKQFDDKDALQNEGNLEDKSFDEQDDIGKELRFSNHLEDAPRDWKESLINEPMHKTWVENESLDADDGEQNEPMYAHHLQDKNLDAKRGVGNELRYARYLKTKPLDEKFNLENELSDTSILDSKHIKDKGSSENKLGYSSNLDNHLNNGTHLHSRPQARSDNAEDQLAEVYPNSRKMSDQEGEDPAVVKYFLTHGRRHNRNAHSDSFESGDKHVQYANNDLDSEENEENEEPQDEIKLKQAHERLQLEDADGLLVGMHARIGTTDNQMELENVNQDKVTPKHDEEEDIQRQLEEEKLIFYPYVPGQSSPFSSRADENSQFSNARDQVTNFSPDSGSSNTIAQTNSKALKHFRQINSKPLKAFRLDKPNVKVLSGQNEQNLHESDITELTHQSKGDVNQSDDYNIEPLLQSSDLSKNIGYYEKHFSPLQRHVHKVSKRTIEDNPQLVQNLIMDGSEEVYPRYNLRHLLDFESDANQRTNMEQQVDTKQQLVRNTLSQNNIEEQEKNTVDGSNGISHLKTKLSSLSDTNQRHRRAVVKRPGVIWQDEESNGESEEVEEEANQEETELGSNELEASVAKHVSPNVADRFQTHILDSNIAFSPTTDSSVLAKRMVDYAHEMNSVNTKEESERKRRTKKNPTNDATILNESHSADNDDNDSEVQMSEDFKKKETHLNTVKREATWHKKLKGLENKYKNFKVKSKQTQIEENVHDNQIGTNKYVEAKDSLNQEKEYYQVNHLFDPSLRSDEQRIKPDSDHSELQEYEDALQDSYKDSKVKLRGTDVRSLLEKTSKDYEDADQDSYKDSNAKLRGTNARSLLEKTNKDYEDVTKELKQVMKSLVTQGKSKKGFYRENAADSYNELEAQNSIPLEDVKQGRLNFKEESQNQPLTGNSVENGHTSIGYTSQSSNAKLADQVEIEEEDDLKMEYESLPKENEVLDLDSDVDIDVDKQSSEGLSEKLAYFDEADISLGTNSKRGFTKQLHEMAQPVSKIQNYEFSTGRNDFKSHEAMNPESQIKLHTHPFPWNKYSYKSNPIEVSESLAKNPELVKTKLSSDVQLDMNKVIHNENNLSAEMFSGDKKEDSNDIAPHEERLFNEGYDALNERQVTEQDDKDSVESRTHYFSSNVKKRSNSVQHSRNIPQELLDISVSTRELDRLISEGNLPVLKRVKRSNNDSVPLAGVSKNADEQNDKVYNHERETYNGKNIGLTEQKEDIFNIPYDNDFQKKYTVVFKKSLEEKKDTGMNPNQEGSENSRRSDENEDVKRETKEKYNFLKIRDILSHGKSKARSVNFAPVTGFNSNNANAEGSSQLVGDEIIQQLSQGEHDNTKSVSGSENHFLNKRETVHNRNPNVRTAKTINFSKKRNIVNKLNKGHMRSVNKMFHNNVEEKRMSRGEKRRNTASTMADHSLVQHGKYRVNMRRQSHNGPQRRNNNNFKEELYSHNIYKLSPQIRNKMDTDYKMKRHKEKTIGGMKPSRHARVSTADSDVLHLLSERRPTKGMVHDRTHSQIPNQEFSKLRSMAPLSSIQDNSLVDFESFGNDLADYVIDDKNSMVRGAEVSKNKNYGNTRAHISPDESEKQSSLISNDGSWNAHSGVPEIGGILFENENSRNALSNENLRNEAEDTKPQYSHSEDVMYHLDNEKEHPITQYNTKLLSEPKSNYNLDIDNLPSDYFLNQPAIGNKEDKSYVFQNYKLGHSTVNTEGGISFKDKNQYTDSNSKLFRPYDIPNFGDSHMDNLNDPNTHSSKSDFLHPGEYDIFPAISRNLVQPTRCVTKPSMWSQSDDSIPLFPVVDKKHSKPYNGELDDGILGMNIVDTIINQVYGSKNLQHHIGPGLHRNYRPTKIEHMNSQSKARQKMISQITTIIDKGLEEEMKQKACMQLPASLQKFLDWLTKDDTCPPSTHRSHSQSKVHPFYTCDHHNSLQQKPSDLQKKYLLLKKLTDEYDRLSECEKAQVQNVHDVLSMETNIVNKMLAEDEHSKKNSATNHAPDCTSLGDLSGTSETGYNLPVFNYESTVSCPCVNESQFDLPTSFIPLTPDLPCNDSTLVHHTGDEDVDALINQDLEGLGLHQSTAGACCNEGAHQLVKTNPGSQTKKNSLSLPSTYTSHGKQMKDQWMNGFERTRIGDDANVRSSYIDTSTLDGKLPLGQMSNSHWPSEYHHNNYLDSHAKGVRYQREFTNDFNRDYGSHTGYERSSPVRSKKRSHYLGNDQSKYFNDGVYQVHEHPGHSRVRQTHVSNEYRRLLARAEQIRRKRSRGEKSQDGSWGQ